MTLKDIAQSISIPESTLRLYRDEFAEYVPASGEGRRRRYGNAAADTLRQIVARKKEGASAAAIQQELSRNATPAETKRLRTQDDRLGDIAVALATQQTEIALLRADVGALREEISRLVGLLRRQADGGTTLDDLQRLGVARETKASV